MSIANAMNVSMQLCGMLLSLLISLYVACSGQLNRPRHRAFLLLSLCSAALLFFDSMFILFSGNPASVNRVVVTCSVLLVYVLGYVSLMLSTQFLVVCLEERGEISPHPLNISRVVSVVSILIAALSQYSNLYYIIDADNTYIRGSFSWLSHGAFFIVLSVNIFLLLRFRRNTPSGEHLPLIAFVALPVIGWLLRLIFPGFHFHVLPCTCSILLLFLFVQYDQLRRLPARSPDTPSAQTPPNTVDADLVDARLNLMTSQIQPHFIYNTLGAIQQLCMTQPQKASELLQEFSQYLRGNFDELGSSRPIRLSQEIQHTKHYTTIENLRFPDIAIYYDLRARDFPIPALSIQPLVENAIRHGLMGLESGGAVMISTYETHNAFCVSVRDNGVGFDPALPLPNQNEKQLGIASIHKRLELMCRGTLTIKSAPGRGTTALITIPKEVKS